MRASCPWNADAAADDAGTGNTAFIKLVFPTPETPENECTADTSQAGKPDPVIPEPESKG